MHVETTFAQLLGRAPSDEEKARLLRVKDTLQLADNDALWLVLLTLESYDATFRRYPALLATEVRKALASTVDWGGRTVPTARGRQFLGAMKSVAFGALCYLVGRSNALGHLGDGDTLVKVTGSLLRIPAGWMLFALALPPTLRLARGAWATLGAAPDGLARLKAACGLICTSAAIATCAALLWALQRQ